jgi:hypothetical protein
MEHATPNAKHGRFLLRSGHTFYPGYVAPGDNSQVSDPTIRRLFRNKSCSLGKGREGRARIALRYQRDQATGPRRTVHALGSDSRASASGDSDGFGSPRYRLSTSSATFGVRVSRRGLSIVSALNSNDPFTQLGSDKVRELAREVSVELGDGTKSAVLLFGEMVKGV